MKNLLFAFSLLFLSFSSSAQFRMAGTAGAWTSLGGGSYSTTVTFFSDLTGNSYLPNQITTSFYLVTGAATSNVLQEFTITSATNLTFSMADLVVQQVSPTASAPNGLVMVFDPALMNGYIPQVPFASAGATGQLQAAVDTYNARKIQSGSNIDYITTDSFATFTNGASFASIPIGKTVWRTTTGSKFEKTGTNTMSKRSTDDGEQARLGLQGSGATFTFNANLYNKVKVNTGDISAVTIQNPSNFGVQEVGEVFLIGVTAGSNNVAVTWGDVYGTFNGSTFGGMPSTSVPSQMTIYFKFRVITPSVETVKFQYVDGGGGSTVANNGRIFYVSTTGNNATAEVGNPNKPWADPIAAVDAMQNGDKLQVLSPDTFLLADPINLDSLQNIELDFGNATLRRVPESQRNTTLAANYTSGSSITVTSVPSSWQVGDFIRLCNDTTDATGISRPHQIASIVGNVVTITGANFLERYTSNTYTSTSGKHVLEDYYIINGRPGLDENGTTKGVNNNVTIRRGIFDDGWYRGKPEHRNYSWHYNATILLHGRNCVIEQNTFRNYGNECITGTGINMNENLFENGGGSAFHYSGCTDSLHTRWTRGVTFNNNKARNTNQIADAIIGHSAGLITFSCNGGEMTMIGNDIEHNNIVPKAILGIVTGAEGGSTDRENIIMMGNRCFNWNRIVASFDGTSHDVIISDNIFDNCGALNTTTTALDTINTIKICNNLALHGTTLTISNRHKCDPATGTGTTLDAAYNNYGSNPAIVAVDNAEGQGNLDFNVSSGRQIRMRGFGAGFIIAGSAYASASDRRNIEVTDGDTYISPAWNSDFVEIQDALKTRIVRYLNSKVISYHSTGADTLHAEGVSRGDFISGSFNNGGRAWKNSYAFDQIYNIAADRFAVIDHFGDLSDPGSVSAPDGYALRAIGLRLNGSSSGRRYDIFRVGRSAIIATTGTRTDTLSGLHWKPVITSTGGGFTNWPIDINSGISWFRTGTSVHIQGNLHDRTGSAGTTGQIPVKDGTSWTWQNAAAADNLGNHTATTTLNMQNNTINNARNIAGSDLFLVAGDSARLEGDNSYLELTTGFTTLNVSGTNILRWNNTDRTLVQQIPDNTVGAISIQGTDGNGYLTVTSTNGAPRMVLGSGEAGAAVGQQGIRYEDVQAISASGAFTATKSTITLNLSSTGTVDANLTGWPTSASVASELVLINVHPTSSVTVDVTGAGWSGSSPVIAPGGVVMAKLINGTLYR